MVPSAGENPRLRLWHWYSFGPEDVGEVQLRPAGGDWETVAIYGDFDRRHTSGGWTRAFVDLSAYAGQTVELAFFLNTLNTFGSVNVGPGWYVDEVAVETGPRAFTNPEDWESGLDDWYATAGYWEAGTPTSGPGACFEGEGPSAQCVGTVLGGNYDDTRHTRLISPSFVVPSAGENPRLRLWHWYSFGPEDVGEVQLRPAGGDWETLETYSGSAGGTWTRPLISLVDYAGQTVELAFFLNTLNTFGSVNVGPGWYIDEVVVDPVLVVANEGAGSGVATAFILLGSYPNPSSASTTISFELPESAEVTLRVFDVLGREVAMVTKQLPAGEHRMPWRAAGLASGVYLYRVEARLPGGTEVRSGRLTLLE